LEDAVNNFLDNPLRYDNQSNAYDESAFNQDRYGGGYDAGTTQAYDIHPYDEIHTSSTYDQEMAAYNRTTAPTRANSRQSSIQPMNDDQTTGVVFGPATQDHYDSHKWALVTTSASEILPDVEPNERYRLPTEPAFIKPNGSGDPLPALITILANIPLIRKALLELGPELPDYGCNDSWWSGSPIEVPEVTHDNESESELDHRTFLAETQRLMAFIVASERLYTTVDPLIKCKAMQNTDQLEEILQNNTTLHNYIDRFVVAWSHSIKYYEGEASLASNLFRTVAVDDDMHISLYTMEIRLDPANSLPPESLYDAIDNMIWQDNLDGQSGKSVYLEKVPQVLVLRVVRNAREGRNLEIDIPAELYLDRYVKENQDISLQMRKNMAAGRREVKAIQSRSQVLGNYQYTPTGSQSKSISLLENSITYLRQGLAPVQQDEVVEAIDIPLTTNEQQARELADKLDHSLESLRAKLADYENQSRSIEAKLQELSDVFKSPNTQYDPSHRLQPKHLYHLRGVCTNHRNVYFQKLTEHPDPEEDWWRYEYTNEPSVIRTVSLYRDIQYLDRNLLTFYR
jgi:hypothetical protein